jgi:DNA invertase Pin-like site-specific DNA recombinase
MKIAAYIRVSTVGQNLASQKAEITRWLKGNASKKSEVTWFVDKSTGTNFERPGFKALQEAVFNGEVDTVVIYKLDRVSRSLCDGLSVITQWLESGIRLVATSQQFDFAGSTGKLILAVLLGVAEMEQETRRERQAAGIAEAKKAGKYRGRKAGTTKADAGRAAVLKSQGLNVSEIANAMGVSRPTAYKYLAARK